MNVLEAIHSRRSVGAVKKTPLRKDIIEKLLAAGNAAPNHFKIRPWRFIVLQGPALDKLAQAHVDSFLKKNPDAKPEHLEIERNKGYRSPLVIAVASTKPVEPKEKDVENISAAAAACQNILLAAHELGLGAIWRTAMYYFDADIKQCLGITDDQHLIGVLCIGESENYDTTPAERPSYEDRTTWL